MTERHAFLRAIKANPDDDTPRLVYADWLDDHGESERAELIRVGIELARRLDEPARDWEHLFAREDFLSAWFPRPFPLSIHFDFERGICQDFECDWGCWREHGDAIWERELPWRVRLTTWPGVALDEHHRGTANLRSVWRWTLIDFPFSVPFEGGESRDMAIRRLLAARWPGIDFELPPVGEVSDVEAQDAALRMVGLEELTTAYHLAQAPPRRRRDLPRG